LTTKLARCKDQLFPLFVMHTLSELPGLTGLFVAGVFSTALSTMSTSVNTLAGTIYQDFIRTRMPPDTSEKRASNIMKIIAFIIGLISLGLVFLVEKMGGVLEVSLSMHGITLGPLLGLFTLGMLFPSANTIGALCGGIGSTILTGFLVGGVQYYRIQGVIKHSNKPLSTDGCGFNLTSSISDAITTAAPMDEPAQPFGIFFISFYFFTFIGTVLVLLIGLPVSWVTRNKRDAPVDSDLLSPCIYWLLPEKQKGKLSTRYVSVERALENILAKEIGNKKVTNNDNMGLT